MIYKDSYQVCIYAYSGLIHIPANTSPPDL